MPLMIWPELWRTDRSETRLTLWRSNHVQLNEFSELVRHVDEWLNGSVFPVSSAKIRDIEAERIQKMASVFSGEQVASGQLPLFDIYDFSFIPIETLSVIYEQFLHDRIDSSGESEGEAKSAYYTPLPVVNYMLDKLDSHRPLKLGMRVLDCACGSGAFLVQCYRKLIERRLQELGRRLRPVELGKLLTQHIFGVDIDEDACQIAELSLALTLLEYIDPPDLTGTQFKLPALRDRNIFCANAFNDNSPWYEEGLKRRFQWIVGNPPWKELKPQKLDEAGKVAWQWIEKERKQHPVSGNQIAEAFVWRASEVLDPDGAAALLLPAMTLFKYESTAFRKQFLKSFRLWAVANFANLANVLFGGRATLPCAALFYSPPHVETQDDDWEGHTAPVFRIALAPSKMPAPSPSSSFHWYNEEHHHSGISLLTPAVLHHGQAPIVIEKRQSVLDAAYIVHPERFVKRPPQSPPAPAHVWINKPSTPFEDTQ